MFKRIYIKRITSIFTVLCAAVLLCSCGANRGNRISTDGSTSMEWVVGALGEAFEIENPYCSFTYNPTGSGSGIAAVLEERCDIGLSSRELKSGERESGLVATVLAYDAIVLIVNKDNPVSDLSLEQIAAVYTGEITNWKQLGGDDLPIVLIGREAGSGTRDGFEAVVGVAGRCRYRQELTSSGDVITTVSSNPNAIGYASLASVKDTVKALSVGSVAPSEQTVRDGTYPVWRPFILVTRGGEQPREAVKMFFEFIKSDWAREIIAKAGVIAAE